MIPRIQIRARHLLPLVAASVFTANAGADSSATDVPAPRTSTSDIGETLAEVLVSARKVTERAQDVPASVAALDSVALERASVASLVDVGRAVPGLNVVSAGPGKNQLIIRGLSSAGGDSMVGYYIDDTPIAAIAKFGTGISDPAVFDLARVEVLRGPQGTLYGASSMGGTIKYVTQQPDLQRLQLGAKATTSYTELGGLNRGVNTILNVPLIDDVMAVRVGGFYRNNDGYIDRYQTDSQDILQIAPGTVHRNVNTEETYGGRVTVRIQPTDYLTITPSASVQRMDLGGQFSFDYGIATLDHPFQSRPLAEPSSDDQQLYALNMRAEFDRVAITSSTSYFERTNDLIEDDSKETYFFYAPLQASVYPVPFLLHFPNRNLTEELRASFDLGRFSGVVGGFYQRVVSRSRYDWPITEDYNEAFDEPFPGEVTFYRGSADLRDVQKALFAELSFEITPQLKALLGVRRFQQEQLQKVAASGVLQGEPASNEVSSRATGYTPKYGLSYSFNDDFMTYLTVSKGFRGGGSFVPIPLEPCAEELAELGLTSSPTQYKPDSLWNYEIGAKSQWLDRRLTVNTSAYHIKWKDVQQSVSLPRCGFAFTGNFGEANSEGAELEVQYELTPAFRVGMQVAFNEAQLTETVVGTNGVAGQPLLFAPKWTGSATAEYRRDISATATMVGQIDFNSSSHAFRGFDRDALKYRQAGYSLLNARLTTEFDQWQIGLFATNLLDKRAATAPQAVYSSSIPPTYRAALLTPRTIGVDLMFRY